MLTERTAAFSDAATAATDDRKRELEHRMDVARESITQTVSEIKDTVAEQYQSVKDSISQTLDWREQFAAHPAAWTAGAFALGYTLGSGIGASLTKKKHKDSVMRQLLVLADTFSAELSQRRSDVLVPALTALILSPSISTKLREVIGVDVSEETSTFLRQALTPRGSKRGKKKSSKKRKADRKKNKKQRLTYA